ncbi:MAG: EAL domain-containing protein [Ruminococcaceae bacterium]|nr:EAL domain-containing protein [Oscillospiraceae bacterium]
MSSNLCNNNFIKFFNEIESLSMPLDNLADAIGNLLPTIAADIFLGKTVFEFNIAPSPYGNCSDTVEKVLFLSPDGSDSEAVQNEQTTGDNATVILKSYPVKGHIWSKEEADSVEFLHKNIFLILGRERLKEIISSSLSRDALTQLPNAAGFVDIGQRLFKQNELFKYTAMYFNLKKFKRINAQIGSKNGDVVLKKYAATIRSLLADDEHIARLGGDNFTMLVKKNNVNNVLDVLSETQIEIEIGNAKLPFVISSRVGVYHIDQGDSMGYVMNCISTAINTARHSTTDDVVVFTTEIMNKIERERKLMHTFPTALKQHEFLVYYQPKVSLADNIMCGCEALARWKRDGVLVPPSEFIPIFERDGSICALDFYILDCVCRDIREWLEQGLEPVTVSVNFSKTHLHNPSISDDIMAIINKYAIDTRYIEIELTEMSDFKDYEAFKTLVNNMKENGVMTSIDDFGTGYSSLNLLTDFMFDVVKLDKSFLDNMARSGSGTDEIVVRNIVKMIKELGMKAIAEGVETVEQASFLKDIDCTMVQGFLFDKPLSKEEFQNRLKLKEYNQMV